ncbi:hypothetical protein HG531_005738 [Fusarium graminearum]|nr:hypothetical protein HG531_005738 [Fusarium graminearum]
MSSVGLIRTTSAASIATSVPLAMAMPTSAVARAGESLMPSPTMPTTSPDCWISSCVNAIDGHKDVGGSSAVALDRRFTYVSRQIDLLCSLDSILGDINTIILQKDEISNLNEVSCTARGSWLYSHADTLAYNSFEVTDSAINGSLGIHAQFFLCSAQDSLANGVFAPHLGQTHDGPPQSFVDIASGPLRDEICAGNAHFSVRNCASLIKDDMRDLGYTLQGSASFDENSVLGPNSCTDHDGRGRSEPKGTWTGKDDDGNAQLDTYHDFTTAIVFKEDLRRVR